MTTYRFWSGLDTIGGNIVEVRTEKARVICDFGLSVASNIGKPIESNIELENKIQSKMIPAIPDLFDTTAFEIERLKGFDEESIETVMFISHLHLDHMGALRFLPKTVTVYMSKDSLKLYHLLADIDEDIMPKCKIKSFISNETIRVGDITIYPQPSDHDAKGSCAYFIETNELRLIHSGDFRLNGQHPERVLKWADKARAWEADVLLIEGTSFSSEDSNENSDGISLEQEREREDEEIIFTEALLLEFMETLLDEKMSKLVVFNPYIRNLERLKQMDDVVTESNRTMVWEEPYAYVLNAFYPECTWTVLEESKQGLLDKELIKNYVTLKDIKEKPNRFVLQNSFKNHEYLKGFNKGLYLHSNGEPLGDYDPRYEMLQNFLKEEGMTFVPFSASGHAKQEDLLKIAKKVSAKQTIPWHSFRPEAFYKALEDEGIAATLPEYNVEYRSQLESIK